MPHTKLTRCVYMGYKRPVVHRFPPKSFTAIFDLSILLWTGYQDEGKSIITRISLYFPRPVFFTEIFIHPPSWIWPQCIPGK